MLITSNKTYLLVIDTNKYSGDFLAEMAAFLLGHHDSELMHSGIKEFALKGKVAEKIEKSLVQKIKNVMVEDDLSFFSLWETQGRAMYNGACADEARFLNAGIKKYNKAYESVALYFKEELSREEVGYLKEKAHLFCKFNNGLVIENFKVLEKIEEQKITYKELIIL